MASSPANMAGGLGSLTQLKELRQRLMFLLGALFVYRVGTYIPVPGIDPHQLAQLFDPGRSGSGILGMFDMFSGGALSRLSLFALGIMPYISASIIMQLLAVVVPSLEALKKEGESGRRKITQYTRYATVGLAMFQALGVAVGLHSQAHMVTIDKYNFYFITVVSLVTGTMFLMWLGEQVTERGIGNGISMIIFAGVVAGLPRAVGATLQRVSDGTMSVFSVLLLAAIVLGVTAFVIYVERGQRRITVNYAKRQQGRRVYAAQTSHLPLKLNMSGVIPPIFASSLILFPSFLARSFSGQDSWLSSRLGDFAQMLSPGQPLYVVLYSLLIVFFCFFYTALVFNSRETADNLKKSGAFIPGIRPGEHTARYIDGVLSRLTTAGAIYITLVCLLPEFLMVYWEVPFYFGGTSLLIIVVVVMDFMAQLQAHLMSHQYEGLMKKSNLKSYGRTGMLR